MAKTYIQIAADILREEVDKLNKEVKVLKQQLRKALKNKNN